MTTADDAPTITCQLVTMTPSDLRDRKSTRLNSSHGYISYAVFCLKKKKNKKDHKITRVKKNHAYIQYPAYGSTQKTKLLMCCTPHNVSSNMTYIITTHALRSLQRS